MIPITNPPKKAPRSKEMPNFISVSQYQYLASRIIQIAEVNIIKRIKNKISCSQKCALNSGGINKKVIFKYFNLSIWMNILNEGASKILEDLRGLIEDIFENTDVEVVIR
ncbi:hypothetical protein ABOONEI_2125 [Aciduliprofundum boonei T469]|nr:hypothetical protein ABOONEI_2125 [Aciduliprofundum boonei T469]